MTDVVLVAVSKDLLPELNGKGPMVQIEVVPTERYFATGATAEMILHQVAPGEISDGYHTFNELYRHRMLLTAALLREWYWDDRDLVNPPELDDATQPHKSWRHSDGQSCGEAFGTAPGSWFIVVAQLPTGQISYHYEAKHWDLFKIPERDLPAEFDGHTPEQAAQRLESYLFDL